MGIKKIASARKQTKRNSLSPPTALEWFTSACMEGHSLSNTWGLLYTAPAGGRRWSTATPTRTGTASRFQLPMKTSMVDIYSSGTSSRMPLRRSSAANPAYSSPSTPDGCEAPHSFLPPRRAPLGDDAGDVGPLLFALLPCIITAAAPKIS